MGKIKTAYELAMERLVEKDPEMKQETLPLEVKQKIAEIRRIYQARIAEREIMLKSKITELRVSVPIEQFLVKKKELEMETKREIARIEEEMNSEIEKCRSGK